MDFTDDNDDIDLFVLTDQVIALVTNLLKNAHLF